MTPAGRIAPQDWMTAAQTGTVMAALNRDGGTARFVGGAVRDTLLGRAVTDVDMATDLKPEMVIERLEAAGVEVIPTGLKHGTVTAVTGKRHFEITTLRVDVETYGRHARVAFGANWQADAERRDFTMNALYLDADGTLYDPTGGRADLEAGRIRFVGDPATRIAEDYLRVLRFFRFQAHLGRVRPDEAALEACRAAAPKLAGLSAERIRIELLKLLAAPAPPVSKVQPGPAATVRIMSDLGILAPILPEAIKIDRLAIMTYYEASLAEEAAPVRRLAALLKTGDPRAVASRLRLSNAEADRLANILDPSPLPRADMRPNEVRAEIYRAGATRFIDRALLAATKLPDPKPFSEVMAVARSFERPKLPVAGRDLVSLGVPKGPAVGQLLRQLEERWIAGDFTESRDALLAWARTQI